MTNHLCLIFLLTLNCCSVVLPPGLCLQDFSLCLDSRAIPSRIPPETVRSTTLSSAERNHICFDFIKPPTRLDDVMTKTLSNK